MLHVLLVVLCLGVAGCAASRHPNMVPSGQVAAYSAEHGQHLTRVAGALAIGSENLCREHPVGVMLLPGTTTLGCAIGIVEKADPTPNAFTDGQQIVVTTGLMDFIKSDDELAVVIGHELGHILRDHVQDTRTGTLIGAFFDGVAAGRGVQTNGVFSQIGGRVFNPLRESEADRWGMFIAARAGYNASAATEFWRRMPDADSGLLATHPTNETRIENTRLIAKEIEAKRARMAPLDPASRD